jgi:hypothetical protein
MEIAKLQDSRWLSEQAGPDRGGMITFAEQRSGVVKFPSGAAIISLRAAHGGGRQPA